MPSLNFFKKKSIQIAMVILFLLFVGILAYSKSFNDVEQICYDKKYAEIYLINYISMKGLKKTVIDHNSNLGLPTSELKRVYLLNPIFRISSPISETHLNYKCDGCGQIDNMDIYCEVRYRKLKNGKVDVWYNFIQ